jgi:hypothetical protein
MGAGLLGCWVAGCCREEARLADLTVSGGAALVRGLRRYLLRQSTLITLHDNTTLQNTHHSTQHNTTHHFTTHYTRSVPHHYCTVLYYSPLMSTSYAANLVDQLTAYP